MTELLSNVNFWYSICVLIIILIAVAMIKSHLKKPASGQTSSVGTAHIESVGIADKDRVNYPYELTLRVDGMNCADCAARVENMLNRQAGIRAQANVYTRKVTIFFQNKADADRFCHDIEAIHPYHAVKVKENKSNI